MEERYKDQFEKALDGWMSELGKQESKVRARVKEAEDEYWNKKSKSCF